jgi:chromosome segregation ATPase
LRTLTEQLDEQRNTHSLSDNAQIAEITKLRTDLAQAIADKERAVKSAATAESTLDYTKEQYRLAQDAATSSSASVTELTAQVSKLSHAASAQPAKLKALHLDRQYETQVTQIKSLKAENNILKKTLQAKEDELQRAKLSGGRMGVGTRATSMTPQPSKVRSRAASPMAARMSNLRNG